MKCFVVCCCCRRRAHLLHANVRVGSEAVLAHDRKVSTLPSVLFGVGEKPSSLRVKQVKEWGMGASVHLFV